MILKLRWIVNFICVLGIIFIFKTTLPAYQSEPTQQSISQEVQTTLEHISANSLKGHVSFLASDLLRGRNTPSEGLNIAAEYIATQFRRAGLETVANNGYFQTTNWVLAESPQPKFLSIKYRNEVISTSDCQMRLFNYFDREIDINEAEIFVLTAENIKNENLLSQIENKVVLSHKVDNVSFDLLLKILSSKALLYLSTYEKSPTEAKSSRSNMGRLVHEEEKQKAKTAVPMASLSDPKILKIFDSFDSQKDKLAISLKCPPPKEKIVKLNNVIGLLPGSDPILKDTYLLVTAHYDHLGGKEENEEEEDEDETKKDNKQVNKKQDLEEDTIFNGANDNASGTASLIELADTLSKLKQRPKRSILFIAFFGEEKGLYGSRYYAKHPVIALEKTVAQINLEQLGRTDTKIGEHKSSLSMTGFDFTDIGKAFSAAGEKTGIKFYKDEEKSDLFFFFSDNRSLADVGVPAHTVCVTYDFPDHHKLDDHWEKIDYENMEKVNKMIALTVVSLSNDVNKPKWNESNPKTKRYVEAWKKLHHAN